MKPQDLRIGNYVRIKVSGRIVQVCAIDENEVGVYYKSAGVKWLTLYRYHDIEPVLIREVYNLLPTILYFEWYVGANGNEYYYDEIPVSYLHELQNIHYALTGNEIEIEL